MKSPLQSKLAKAEMLKAIKIGTTSAKTAKAPTKKLSKAATKKTEEAKAANAKWENPNLLAIHRMMAGTDLAAGALLHHIVFEWRNRKKKLSREGRDWLAHSREAWAAAAGLTSAEFKNRALPRLKKHCCGFLTVRAMGNGADKKLWVSVDEMAMRERYNEVSELPLDMLLAQLNGIGPGNQKSSSYAYSGML